MGLIYRTHSRSTGTGFAFKTDSIQGLDGIYYNKYSILLYHSTDGDLMHSTDGDIVMHCIADPGFLGNDGATIPGNFGEWGADTDRTIY